VRDTPSKSGIARYPPARLMPLSSRPTLTPFCVRDAPQATLLSMNFIHHGFWRRLANTVLKKPTKLRFNGSLRQTLTPESRATNGKGLTLATLAKMFLPFVTLHPPFVTGTGTGTAPGNIRPGAVRLRNSHRKKSPFQLVTGP